MISSFYNILEILPSIRYAALCYRYGKLDEFIACDNQYPDEDYYSCFFDAIGSAADFFEIGWNEAFETNTFYISFDSMMEYYRLCRVYSKARHIWLKNNPFMIEARQFVESTFHLDNFGGYYVRLQTKVNHRWASGLVIYTDANYFNAEFDLAEAVFETGAWYRNGVYQLRKKLLEEGIIYLPALQEHRENDHEQLQ